MDRDVVLDFRRKLLHSFYFFLFVMASGTVGYRLIGGDGYSIIDCFYMTVITVATVGYGEIIDLSANPGGRVFTIILIFSGMSVILYFMSNVTAFLIEGHIKEIFWRKKMQKLINGLKGHYLICGVGRLGMHIAQELSHTKRPAVLIEINHSKVETLKDRFPGMGMLIGDATDQDTLIEAGIERARGLIAASGNDKDNLVIAITARQIAPGLRIVARCNEMKNADKLKRAGADSVVSSNYIGGLRMVSEMVRPTVVTFLDRMLRDREKNLRIEELNIPPGSPLIGKTAAAVKKHALVLALKTKADAYEYNPRDDFRLEEGLSLIFMGSPEDRARLEGLL